MQLGRQVGEPGDRVVQSVRGAGGNSAGFGDAGELGHFGYGSVEAFFGGCGPFVVDLGRGFSVGREAQAAAGAGQGTGRFGQDRLAFQAADIAGVLALGLALGAAEAVGGEVPVGKAVGSRVGEFGEHGPAGRNAVAAFGAGQAFVGGESRPHSRLIYLPFSGVGFAGLISDYCHYGGSGRGQGGDDQ